VCTTQDASKLPLNIEPVTLKNVDSNVAAMIADFHKSNNSLGQTAAMIFESHGLLIRCARALCHKYTFMTGLNNNSIDYAY
jgi:hypothetical protein